MKENERKTTFLLRFGERGVEKVRKTSKSASSSFLARSDPYTYIWVPSFLLFVCFLNPDLGLFVCVWFGFGAVVVVRIRCCCGSDSCVLLLAGLGYLALLCGGSVHVYAVLVMEICCCS